MDVFPILFIPMLRCQPALLLELEQRRLSGLPGTTALWRIPLLGVQALLRLSLITAFERLCHPTSPLALKPP